MKLTTAHLKRLIKEELESVMQGQEAPNEKEMSDLEYNLKTIRTLMKYGMSDYKDLREQYPQSYRASVKLAQHADAETLDAVSYTHLTLPTIALV